jgi:hypothetical protein
VRSLVMSVSFGFRWLRSAAVDQVDWGNLPGNLGPVRDRRHTAVSLA